MTVPIDSGPDDPEPTENPHVEPQEPNGPKGNDLLARSQRELKQAIQREDYERAVELPVETGRLEAAND